MHLIQAHPTPIQAYPTAVAVREDGGDVVRPKEDYSRHRLKLAEMVAMQSDVTSLVRDGAFRATGGRLHRS